MNVENIINLPDAGNSLAVAKPQIALQFLAAINLGKIKGKVLELSLELALGAFDGDDTRLHVDSDYNKRKDEIKSLKK